MLRIALLAIVLAGCAYRGDLQRMDGPDNSGAELRNIFFATSRETDELPFGSGRSERLYFGLAQVSIPPSHKPGQIEWPRGTPDPEKHFLLASTETYPDANGLRSEINQALKRRSKGERDVLIFVHGFNTRFGDGVYRMAQMAYDLGEPGVAVLYSWPSAGNPLNYAYDRDSALFARRGLTELIQEVSKSQAENIILVAHSLGSLVTMEGLRQLITLGDEATFNRIGGVILMSPDVDVDVFKAQADEIGTLPDPFVVFSSKKDRALRLVERLTGQADRLGSLSDLNEISEYPITYIDVTAFSEGGTNHFPTAKSPALLRLLRQLPSFDDSLATDGGRTGFFPGTALTVRNVTNVVLAPTQRDLRK